MKIGDIVFKSSLDGLTGVAVTLNNARYASGGDVLGKISCIKPLEDIEEPAIIAVVYKETCKPFNLHK